MRARPRALAGTVVVALANVAVRAEEGAKASAGLDTALIERLRTALDATRPS